MRRNKRSENKIELLKEADNALILIKQRGIKIAERIAEKRAIENNRRRAFVSFAQNERMILESAHRLSRAKSFSEYLIKMPKFFDEPELYLDYCRIVREIKTAFLARLILIGLHWWLFKCILVSGGSLVAAGFYFLTLPLVAFLVLRRDLNRSYGELV